MGTTLSRVMIAGSLIALVSACLGPSEDAESSAGAITVVTGCPPTPSCTDWGSNGRLCIPECAEQCQTTHREVDLWVSPYKVAGTYGLGRHQGIAIVAVEYGIDERINLRAPVGELSAHTWPAVPTVQGLPADMARAMSTGTGAHDHSSSALCGPPRIVFDRPLANHGRALSRDATDAASRVRLAADARDKAPGDVQAAQGIQKVDQCIAKIQNGFCDSVCGNCSYVLPDAATLTSAAGDWSAPKSRVAGDGTCAAESYYGGPGQMSLPITSPSPNPFTHCALLGCGVETEAPSLKSLVADAPVTGLFGHNSNADAEAEFQAFRACIDGSGDVLDACSACGVADAGGRDRQSPCAARTNTAQTFWSKTADAKLGVVVHDHVPPISRAGVGDALPPVCRWGGFPVHGM